MPGAVDYLCNAIAPERADAWDRAIAAQGIPLKVRRGPDDGFVDEADFVARLDRLGVATVLVSTGDVTTHPVGAAPLHEVTARWEETEALAARHPGRFLALWCIEPHLGMAGVRRAAEALDEPWVAGLYLHVHSFDRPFDHADHYPFYALCAERGVPMVMQAGTSGGFFPSECGRPIGVDRPALYFPDTTFVLSHTGWPWVDEAIAMALKFPNVFLGCAAYPPAHWGDAVVRFLTGPGRTKTLWGTNFPTVGHEHSLRQLDALGLPDEVRHLLVEGNARRVFGRLPAG